MAAAISSGVEVGGRWRLGGQLGPGAFGLVFRADDTSTLNLGAAAVKVLHPSTSPEARKAFHDEIGKVVSLRHPNLVAYLDSGEHRADDGQHHPFLVTELCQYSLQAYLAGGPGRLTADQGERLLADMSAGLGYLHSRGLLHQDLKPANVLLGGDDWKLGDFGLTLAVSATGDYHHGTVVMGTPRYLAPELYEGGAASAASDVYAMGVTLHQALTGRTVHGGTDVPLLVQVATTPPRIERDLPLHWRRLIERCLERDPANRPGASQLPAVLAESRLTPSSPLAQLSGTSPLARHLGQPLPPPPPSARSLHPSAQPTPVPRPAEQHPAAPPARALRPAGAGSPGTGTGTGTSDDAGLAFGVPSAAWGAAPRSPPGPPARQLDIPRSPTPGPAGAAGPAADTPAPDTPEPAAAGPSARLALALNHAPTGHPVGPDDLPGPAPASAGSRSGEGPSGGGRRLALIGVLTVVALVLVGVVAVVATRRGGDEQASDTTGLSLKAEPSGAVGDLGGGTAGTMRQYLLNRSEASGGVKAWLGDHTNGDIDAIGASACTAVTASDTHNELGGELAAQYAALDPAVRGDLATEDYGQLARAGAAFYCADEAERLGLA